MTRWVIIAAIAVLLAVLLTRRWSPVTRLAADSEFGRRHHIMVKFWRLWLTLAAVAAAGVIWAVAAAPGTAPATGAHTAPPVTHAAPHTATGGEGGTGMAPAVIVLVALGAAGVLTFASVALGRRREQRALERFLAEGDPYEYNNPWVGASPARARHAVAAAGTAAAYEYETEEVDDEGSEPDDEEQADEDAAGDELVDTSPDATVHPLPRRRRRRNL
jgi:hypothetical protein